MGAYVPGRRVVHYFVIVRHVRRGVRTVLDTTDKAAAMAAARAVRKVSPESKVTVRSSMSVEGGHTRL